MRRYTPGMREALATLLLVALISGCGGSQEAGPSADPPGQSAVPAKRYKNCDVATREEYVRFKRAVTKASQGDLVGVEAAGLERVELVLANRKCFAAADVATAKKLRDAEDDLPDLAKKAPEECRDTVADVANLFNFAAGLKAVSEEDSAKAAEGFGRISERDPDCFNEDDVQTVLGNLADHQP